MNTKGIRISDIKEGKCISLSEVLTNIRHPNQFNWALLWFDVIPIEKEGVVITKLQKRVNNSEKGIPYTFKALTEISSKIFQEIEILILGCKKQERLQRYKDDQKMYEACDIVIEIIDGGLWEIFSKNVKWINQLAERYEEVEFLKSDFQKKSPPT